MINAITQDCDFHIDDIVTISVFRITCLHYSKILSDNQHCSIQFQNTMLNEHCFTIIKHENC